MDARHHRTEDQPQHEDSRVYSILLRLFVFVTIGLLVMSASAAPVSAQLYPGNATGPPTGGNTTGGGSGTGPGFGPGSGVPVTGGGSDGTRETSAPSGSGGGSSGGGGGLLNLNPWGFVAGAVSGAVQDLSTTAAGLIDGFHSILLGVPAAGEIDRPSTWISPAHGTWWYTAYVLYYALVGVLILPAMWRVVQTFATSGPTSEEDAREAILLVVKLMVGFLWLQGLYHAGNAVVMGFVPNGEEFFATPGNLVKLGLGVLIGGVALSINAVAVVVAVVAGLMLKFLQYFLTALYPVAVYFRHGTSGASSTSGAVVVAGTYLIVLIRGFQAVALWFAFHLPMDVTNPQTVGSILMVMVITLVVFIVVPYAGAKKVIPEATAITYGKIKNKGGEVRAKLQGAANRATHVHETFTEIRESTHTETQNRASQPSGSRQPSGGGSSGRRGRHRAARKRRQARSDGGGVNRGRRNNRR